MSGFQRANGLAADGDAGPQTRKSLLLADMDFLCGDKLSLNGARTFRPARTPGEKATERVYHQDCMKPEFGKRDCPGSVQRDMAEKD